MALYFLRHAQTPGNATNVWVGRNDQPLSEKGRMKLEQKALELSAIDFALVLTSPLQRAHATAKAIALAQRGKVDIVVRHGLQERDFGCLEGQPKSHENRLRLQLEETVEPIESLRKRIEAVVVEAESLPGNILLVSHSAVYNCIVRTMGYRAIPARDALENLDWCELRRSRGEQARRRQLR
ncbi:histidine phosphatase family protein [Stutzerimonas kirkiae]|uniref:Histidine phosphatase family protein n=1 Tax=Stutzerimonas kirkiae TaxID=2211392 RepID=A0A4Q9RCH0_9GAMM|nr:histidine phosphatase family protein [Stutzerimonas kirkiae]TBU97740.1 hypothetical protein DNJ96_07765 [Stutzerimonas kirkiae]TBV04909.1 hypothetical protein DNJ95_04360 [Stutzerimonas kirkiae]TBV12045.1 hypothetical protein DNK08_01495 [Stutzerimonas kirkiae]TBV14946.1 hypothetical protein DNK01_07570 [Stutzerimonas kirkiae]